MRLLVNSPLSPCSRHACFGWRRTRAPRSPDLLAESSALHADEVLCLVGIIGVIAESWLLQRRVENRHGLPVGQRDLEVHYGLDCLFDLSDSDEALLWNVYEYAVSGFEVVERLRVPAGAAA
jgi:hypothetical protein